MMGEEGEMKLGEKVNIKQEEWKGSDRDTKRKEGVILNKIRPTLFATTIFNWLQGYSILLRLFFQPPLPRLFFPLPHPFSLNN